MKLVLLLAIIGTAAGGILWEVTRESTTFPTPTCTAPGRCPVEPHNQSRVGYDCRTVKSGTLKPDREICTYREP